MSNGIGLGLWSSRAAGGGGTPVRRAPGTNVSLSVSISPGSGEAGDTFTAIPAGDMGSPEGTSDFQWKRDGVEISGATSASYESHPEDDADVVLTVDLVVTNSEGSDDATSAGVSVDAPPSGEFTGYDIIGVWEQSNGRGTGLGSPTLDVSLDADPTGRICQLAIGGPSAGSIVDVGTGVIYAPNGTTTTEVGVSFHFAKYYAEHVAASNRKVLIVPYVMGGQSYIGNPGFNPDGAGPAYGGDDGCGGSGAPADGSLYLGFVNACNHAIAQAEAEFGPGSSAFVGIYGGPGENDEGSGRYTTVYAKMKAFIAGARAGITGASGSWAVQHGPVPERAFSGAVNSLKTWHAKLRLEEDVARYAFVEGPVGYQSGEAVHFTEPGNRVKAALAAAAVPIAAARSSPVQRPVDFLDGLANVGYAAGLVRFLSAYGTGKAFALHNGTSQIDINFLSSGYPDWAAALAHCAGVDGTVVALYDQVSGTRSLVPGTHTAPKLIASGELLLIGGRPAFGDDAGSRLLADATYALPTAGAVLILGHLAPGSGSRVYFSSQTNAPSLGRVSSGPLVHRTASDWRSFDTEPAGQPAGMTKYYANHAILASQSAVYVDGQLAATTAGATGPSSYSDAGTISLGGRAGATNRYGQASYAGCVCFDVAPTGDYLATVNAYAALYAAKTSAQSAAAEAAIAAL